MIGLSPNGFYQLFSAINKIVNKPAASVRLTVNIKMSLFVISGVVTGLLMNMFIEPFDIVQ